MKLRITIEGVTYDVEVEVVEDGTGNALPHPPAAPAPPRPVAAAPAPAAPARAPKAAPVPTGGSSDKTCKSPIAGTILNINVKPGDRVALNQVLLVMEAMKMETNVASPIEGVVHEVLVEKGAVVKQGQPLVTFE